MMGHKQWNKNSSIKDFENAMESHKLEPAQHKEFDKTFGIIWESTQQNVD